ncbi:histone-lysine N-methyltransferase SETMAR [Trichonephila clavipes]|nr:histone-lysine N-methyltransferase SETMAR [Trichonephila clavipes]
MNATRFCATLSKLKDVIRKKLLRLLKSGVLLLDDNARPHSAKAMQNHIATLIREPLHYPPYSHDLSPSDFHLFSGFGSNAAAKQAIKCFFHMQSSEILLERSSKLIKREGTERNEYIVPLQNGVILSSHRTASPLVRLVEGEEMWKVLDLPRKLNLKIGMELNKTLLSAAWGSKLRLTIDVQISSCHDELMSPSKWHRRSVGISNNNRNVSTVLVIQLSLLQIDLGQLDDEVTSPWATRWLLATNLVILNHGQVTRTIPELAPPLPATATMGGLLRSRQMLRASLIYTEGL